MWLGHRRRRGADSVQLFGEVVFHRGAAGIGIIWGCARHRAAGAEARSPTGIGRRITFEAYKLVIFIGYVVHGAHLRAVQPDADVRAGAGVHRVSRAAVAVKLGAENSELLATLPNEFRGRVFATIETLTWATMMVSMMVAGIASDHYSPRTIGTVAGVLSSTTAIFWGWANFTGRLPSPRWPESSREEVEVHGDPVV